MQKIWWQSVARIVASSGDASIVQDHAARAIAARCGSIATGLLRRFVQRQAWDDLERLSLCNR
jgi:hypothetical protein